MAPSPWKLDCPCKELDEHLENAFKRVAGIIGHKMQQDRMNLKVLSGSALDIVDMNLAPTEPFFMRIGRSVATAASYRPKGTIDLKELAAEVLNEWERSSFRLSASLMRIRLPPATEMCRSSSKACGARNPPA